MELLQDLYDLVNLSDSEESDESDGPPALTQEAPLPKKTKKDEQSSKADGEKIRKAAMKTLSNDKGKSIILLP